MTSIEMLPPGKGGQVLTMTGVIPGWVSITSKEQRIKRYIGMVFDQNNKTTQYEEETNKEKTLLI